MAHVTIHHGAGMSLSPRLDAVDHDVSDEEEAKAAKARLHKMQHTGDEEVRQPPSQGEYYADYE